MGRRPSKRKKQRLTVIASALVILAVPIVLAGLIGLESTDPRSKAGLGFQTDLKCVLYFPYVDPNSLEVGKRATVEILADVRDQDAIENYGEEWITNISIFATESKEYGTDDFREVYSRNFDQKIKVSQASEQFLYQPQNVGTYSLTGEVTTINSNGIQGTHLCLLDRSYNQNILDAASTSGFDNTAILAQVVEENSAPKFTTELPSQDKNILKVGDSYEHTLKANDSDNDIQFDAAFTPDANWLKISDTQSTPNDVEVKFAGTADTPGSYLASVLIWDGWNGHTSSQSWVINVDQKENDIPKITFIKPSGNVTVNPGEEVEIEWKVEDLNHISNFKLYLAKNPSDEGTWKPLDENLDFNTTRYILNTTGLSAGDYYAVVKATDNQSPPATGTGSSEKITVSGKVNEENPDDGPQKPGAGVVSISPADKSTVNTTQPLIKATLIASEGHSVIENSIKFFLNNEDLSSKIEIQPHSESQVTISYKPEAELQDLSENKVKVLFEDSDNNKGEREWIFKVEIQPDQEEKVWNIFGYEITAKRGIIAILVLIGIILLAGGIPWLIYILVRGPKDRGEDYNYYPSYSPPTTPTSSGNSFTSSYDDYYGDSSGSSSSSESNSSSAATYDTSSTPATNVPNTSYSPSQSYTDTSIGSTYDGADDSQTSDYNGNNDTTGSSYSNSQISTDGTDNTDSGYTDSYSAQPAQSTTSPASSFSDSTSQTAADTGSSTTTVDTSTPEVSQEDFNSTTSAAKATDSMVSQQATETTTLDTSASNTQQTPPPQNNSYNSVPSVNQSPPTKNGEVTAAQFPSGVNTQDDSQQPSDAQVESIKKLAEQLKQETSESSSDNTFDNQDQSDSRPYSAPPPTVLSND